ncbi:MAG: hypothetical protein ACLGIK_13175, partial [Gemmatimonadota bacterium]
MPRVTGKLDLRVVYPPDRATLAARDSTFLFGSTGTGDARLSINGIDVPVNPNGSWLAWLPIPPRERAEWSLVATSGADTARVTRRIVFPALRPVLSDSGALLVDSASVRPGPREARLSADQFILPLFVGEGTGQCRPVSSMPGVFQMSVDVAVAEA